MNKPIRGAETGLPAEDQVADYLLAHPEFFERHGSVLMRLQLPHQRGSAAVSLVERQVLVLRDRLTAVEKQLHELLDNGRANEAIVDRLHRLTRRLLRAQDATAVLAALGVSLREDFGASTWILVATDPAHDALQGVSDEHLRLVPRASPELKVFETFFESGRPRSGQIRNTQREYLFGSASEHIGSMVLIPLGERGSHGLLAIGSPDTERYLPTMGTDFLVRIGELVTEALVARPA